MPTAKTPSTSKATKATKATKTGVQTIAKTTDTSTVTPTVASTVTLSPAVPASQVPDRIAALQTTVLTLTAQLREVGRELVALQKTHAKEVRASERLVEKLRKKKGGGAKGVPHQSGIAKPGYISEKLCTFIGVTAETKVARTEVIKYINQYIKDNKLQDATNKKVIVPDAKLRELLHNPKEEVTFFNLQTLMKPHYADPSKSATVGA